MTLQQAQSLADAIDSATQQFEAYIRPALQDYIDFTSEHVRAQAPIKCKNAEEYSFKEIESNLFIFESEEFTHYGEWTTDDVELPFSFVDNPEKYKADVIQSIRDREALRLVKSVTAAQDRVNMLKKELAAAEAILARTTSTD